MNNLKKVILFFFLVNISTWISVPKATAQVNVDFQVFYDDLSPYGSWIDNPSYGYVWVPSVDQGFQPYRTNGHWVYTNAGWTWFSDYPWGWAPFHYGRWYNDAAYGPMWVPGNEWGPGWVTWRQSEGYYGWAPIEPGISISVAYSSGYNLPNDRWVFLRDRDFGRTNYNNYYINNSRNTTIITNSTTINNINKGGSGSAGYQTGPDRKDVEKRIGRVVTPYTIKESNQKVQRLNKNQLEIYRPQVKNIDGAGHKPMPTKVIDVKEIKPAKGRNVDSPLHNEKQPGKQIVNQVPVKQQHSNQTDQKQPGNLNQIKHSPAQSKPVNQNEKKQQVKSPDNKQQINKAPMDHQPTRKDATPESKNNQQGGNQNQPTIRESHQRVIRRQPAEQLHNRKQGEPQQQHYNSEQNQQKSNEQPASPKERKDEQNRPH